MVRYEPSSTLLLVAIPIVMFFAISRAPAQLPSTQPATAPNRLHISIGVSSIYLDRNELSMDDLKTKLESISPEARAQVDVEFAPASTAVTAARYVEAKAQIQDVLHDAGITSIHETGVEDPPPDLEPGEYYLGGEVERVGVYALIGKGRRINLRQAIEGAGLKDNDPDRYIVRIVRGDVERITLPLADVLDRAKEDIKIQAGDEIVIVKANPATTKPAPASQPERSR